MTPTTTQERVPPPVEIREHTRRHDWLQRTGASAGMSAAALVAADGSVGWRIARVVVILAMTAGFVQAARRLSGVGRGWLALAVGVPMNAIAIGFVPHWLVGEAGIVPVASGLLMGSAVALTVLGTRAVIQGRPWWRRAAVCIVVLVAVAVTAFVVGPAVAATNPTHADLGATPASAGLASVDVTVRTVDGVDIAGWYVASSNRAAIVLLHGAGSTRSDVLDHAVVLSRAGFGVLMIDARGHGESGGRAMDFGWYGDADIAAATAYLAARVDVDRDRIGLVGLSMGGEQALGASGTDPLVRAVVAEGATARCASDETWLSERYGIRGWLTEQLEVAQDRVTAALTDADVPTSMRASVAASGDTQFLLIAAAHESDEIEAASFIASVAPDRVRTWTVDDADHTGGLDTDRAGWVARVTAFLADTLLD